MSNNIGSLDFRLLRIFGALLVHRSVSKAADALDVPQPAVSQGLNRLRTLLGDPLFVRTGGGMIPTQRAVELREPVTAILAIAQDKMIGPAGFDPAQSKREFRIVCSDFGALTILPKLLPRVRAAAPNVGLRLMPIDEGVFERLAAREADCALGIMTSIPNYIRTRTVYHDTYACALRAGHPALKSRSIKQALLNAEHVAVTSGANISGQTNDVATMRLHRKRTALTVPGFAVLPSLLTETDLIAIVPRTARKVFFSDNRVHLVDAPFATPKITVVEAWHVNDDADVGIRWMLDQVARVFDGMIPEV